MPCRCTVEILTQKVFLLTESNFMLMLTEKVLNLVVVVIVNQQFHQPFSTEIVYATWIGI